MMKFAETDAAEWAVSRQHRRHQGQAKLSEALKGALLAGTDHTYIIVEGSEQSQDNNRIIMLKRHGLEKDVSTKSLEWSDITSHKHRLDSLTKFWTSAPKGAVGLVSKSHELCIQNEESCIQNEDLCT